MNEDPQFERRLLLAFLLSVAVFAVMLRFAPKAAPPPARPQSARPPAAASATAPATAAAPAVVTPPSTPAAASRAAPPGRPAAPGKPEAAAAERLDTVETPVYRVTLSNRGADAHSWLLLKFTDWGGHPLNAVDASFAAQHGYPLAVWSDDAAVRAQLADALFTATRQTAAGVTTLTYRWSDGHLSATRTYRFGADYEVDVTTQLARDGHPLTGGLAWNGGFSDYASSDDFASEQLVLQSDQKLQTLAAKKIGPNATVQGAFGVVGVDDQYFAALALPAADTPLTVTQLKTAYRPAWLAGNSRETLGFGVSQSGAAAVRFYVVPKQLTLLRHIDSSLGGLVEFGVFSFVAEPLFLWMNWTYVHWIHNYGWVIVFITLVLMTALLPFRLRGQKSQSKMMAVQPKVNALNAKMKKYPLRDPRRQEVQQEIMKLYSEHGINPLAGCLPMLVQLPLVWAFYRVLQSAIELRHAPWFGYLHDLSAKDPYFILPLLVVVSQFFSMQMMPSMPGQDPRQMKMMKWVMPLFMGYIFFYFPAGVNLYYLTSNGISAAQQVWINKQYKVQPAPETKPAKVRQRGK